MKRRDFIASSALGSVALASSALGASALDTEHGPLGGLLRERRSGAATRKILIAGG